MNQKTLSALAEPNRLRIVELLREKPCSVGEIAERLQIRQPQASKHLKVLSKAGLVEVHPTANQRIYQLHGESFKELDSWLETFRKVWDTRLNNLDGFLQGLKEDRKHT